MLFSKNGVSLCQKMDELEDKLNSGNPLVATQIVSKLAQIVKNKATNDIFDLVEYKFLKNKSITTDNALNTLASEAILSIVRNEPSLVKSVITDFITVITTTKYALKQQKKCSLSFVLQVFPKYCLFNK